MAIREYHKSRNQGHRNVCIIPVSAHGTNPASAAMCGMRVVVVGCDDKGNINVKELEEKAEQYKDQLAALMVIIPYWLKSYLLYVSRSLILLRMESLKMAFWM